MDYLTIEKNHWHEFFNMFSKMAKGQWVRMELIGEEIGDQIEDDWTLFDGLTYDLPEDVLHIYSASVDHSIPHPEEVTTQENGVTRALIIRDGSGLIQILHLRDPILLNS